MNKYILLLTLIFLVFTETYTQTCIVTNTASPCCNDLISTDARTINGINVGTNTERSNMKNYFDWTKPTWKLYVPALYGGTGGYIDPTDISKPLIVTNPFYTDFTQLEHINYHTFGYADRTPDKLDLAPEFGWELIQKYDGYTQDQSVYLPANQRQRDGPYVIFYNKYSGKLRVLPAFKNIGVNQKIRTDLTYGIYSNTPQGEGYSGLLARNMNYIKPLDQPTEIKTVSTVSEATADGGFINADFNMNYDPCVCNYESTLKFRFWTLNDGKIELSGRLVGTQVSVVDGSGTAVTLNDHNFLTDVYKDDFHNVKSGMLTYKNIDDLAAKYKVQYNDIDPQLQMGLNALFGAFKSGAASVDNNIINKYATQFLSSHFGNITIGGIGKMGPFVTPGTLPVSLGLVASGANMLISMITPQKPPLPNIGFIEAEMALSGILKNTTNLGGTSDIEIKTPGSKNSENTTVTPDKYYPVYNEALGVLSVLETPKVFKEIKTNTIPAHGCGQGCTVPARSQFSHYLSFQELKYYFNPAAEVDEANTTILAGLVIKVDDRHVEFAAKNITKSSTDANGISTYITPYVSLECLQNTVPEIFQPIAIYEVYLKLIIEYQFKPNKYGKVNKHFEILTYPIQYIQNSDPDYKGYSFRDFSGIPQFVTVSGQYFNADTKIYAWNKITVNGNLTVASLKKLQLIAGEEIETINESSINNEIEITTGKQFYTDVIGCAISKVAPVSADYIKTFCSGSKYKAKVSASRIEQQDSPPSVQSFPLKVYVPNIIAIPNPSSNITTFKFNLATDGIFRLYLSDILGREVATIQKGYHTAGDYKTTHDVSHLPNGMYLYTLEAAGIKETQRLEVVH